VLVLVACLLACSTVSGEEFEVEELEVRNPVHHKKVVMVKKEDEVKAGGVEAAPGDEPATGDEAATGDEVEENGTDHTGGTGGTGMPPSYEVKPEVDNGGEAKTQTAAAQTAMSYTTGILLGTIFVLVFV